MWHGTEEERRNVVNQKDPGITGGATITRGGVKRDLAATTQE